MKKTYSESAMLELWRLLRAAEPLRLDCTVGRTHGVDMDAIYKNRMRGWYLNLLDRGREEFLAPENVAEGARVERQGNLTVIAAPEGVRRILRLRFASWPAAIAPRADEATVRARAGNHFSKRPLAALLAPRLVAASGASGQLVELIAAVDHGPQIYCFDDSALLSLTQNTQK